VLIIDGHAHVASTRYVPRQFIQGVAANMAAQSVVGGPRLTAAQIQKLLEAQNRDHHADELVREMDEAGVQSTVLLIPDFSRALECELPIAQMAAEHHQIRLRHPERFYVFQGIDPRNGAQAVDFFDRTIHDYRFEGLKLYPPCGYSPSDESLFPIYEICAARGLPVLLHTGPTSPVLAFECAHPSLIDRAAREFPTVNFILAHGGVVFTEEAAQLCAYRPNVYLDIAGFPGALHPQGWKAHLHNLFRLGINHKIIFGTDWPLFRMSSTTRFCVETLLGPGGALEGLPPREVELVMGGNMMRLLAAAPAKGTPERARPITLHSA
jgi:predicted TIM-barrel fold metal-dependent hydrolase